MAMMLPDEVRTLFLVLTGEEWPDADEDKLRALAQEWDRAADDLEHVLAPALRRAVEAVTASGFEGEAERAFITRMSPFVLGQGNHIAASAAQFRQLAAFLRNLALDVEYVKLISVLTLVTLLAEIAWAVAMAYWTAGGSMAWLAARITVVRTMLKTMLGRLVLNAAEAVVFGVAFQALMDVVTQGIQFAMGTRTEYDTAKLVDAVAIGVVGGVIALPVGAAGKLLAVVGARGLDTLWGKVLVNGRPLNDVLTDMVADMGVGAAQEVFAEAIWTAIKTGEWEFKWASATSGAISTLAGAIGTELGKALLAHQQTQIAGPGAGPQPQGGTGDGPGEGDNLPLDSDADWVPLLTLNPGRDDDTVSEAPSWDDRSSFFSDVDGDGRSDGGFDGSPGDRVVYEDGFDPFAQDPGESWGPEPLVPVRLGGDPAPQPLDRAGGGTPPAGEPLRPTPQPLDRPGSGDQLPGLTPTTPVGQEQGPRNPLVQDPVAHTPVGQEPGGQSPTGGDVRSQDGSGAPGQDPTGSDQTRPSPVETGPTATESGLTGQNQTVLDQTAPDQPVRDQTVRDQPVSDQPASDQPVSDQVGQGRAGQDEPGQDQTGRNPVGVERTGPEQTGGTAPERTGNGQPSTTGSPGQESFQGDGQPSGSPATVTPTSVTSAQDSRSWTAGRLKTEAQQARAELDTEGPGTREHHEARVATAMMFAFDVQAMDTGLRDDVRSVLAAAVRRDPSTPASTLARRIAADLGQTRTEHLTQATTPHTTTPGTSAPPTTVPRTPPTGAAAQSTGSTTDSRTIAPQSASPQPAGSRTTGSPVISSPVDPAPAAARFDLGGMFRRRAFAAGAAGTPAAAAPAAPAPAPPSIPLTVLAPGASPAASGSTPTAPVVDLAGDPDVQRAASDAEAAAGDRDAAAAAEGGARFRERQAERALESAEKHVRTAEGAVLGTTTAADGTEAALQAAETALAGAETALTDTEAAYTQADNDVTAAEAADQAARDAVTAAEAHAAAVVGTPAEPAAVDALGPLRETAVQTAAALTVSQDGRARADTARADARLTRAAARTARDQVRDRLAVVMASRSAAEDALRRARTALADVTTAAGHARTARAEAKTALDAANTAAREADQALARTKAAVVDAAAKRHLAGLAATTAAASATALLNLENTIRRLDGAIDSGRDRLLGIDARLGAIGTLLSPAGVSTSTAPAPDATLAAERDALLRERVTVENQLGVDRGDRTTAVAGLAPATATRDTDAAAKTAADLDAATADAEVASATAAAGTARADAATARADADAAGDRARHAGEEAEEHAETAAEAAEQGENERALTLLTALPVGATVQIRDIGPRAALVDAVAGLVDPATPRAAVEEAVDNLTADDLAVIANQGLTVPVTTPSGVVEVLLTGGLHRPGDSRTKEAASGARTADRGGFTATTVLTRIPAVEAESSSLPVRLPLFAAAAVVTPDVILRPSAYVGATARRAQASVSSAIEIDLAIAEHTQVSTRLTVTAEVAGRPPATSDLAVGLLVPQTQATGPRTAALPAAGLVDLDVGTVQVPRGLTAVDSLTGDDRAALTALLGAKTTLLAPPGGLAKGTRIGGREVVVTDNGAAQVTLVGTATSRIEGTVTEHVGTSAVDKGSDANAGAGLYAGRSLARFGFFFGLFVDFASGLTSGHRHRKDHATERFAALADVVYRIERPIKLDVEGGAHPLTGTLTAPVTVPLELARSLGLPLPPHLAVATTRTPGNAPYRLGTDEVVSVPGADRIARLVGENLGLGQAGRDAVKDVLTGPGAKRAAYAAFYGGEQAMWVEDGRVHTVDIHLLPQSPAGTTPSGHALLAVSDQTATQPRRSARGTRALRAGAGFEARHTGADGPAPAAPATGPGEAGDAQAVKGAPTASGSGPRLLGAFAWENNRTTTVSTSGLDGRGTVHTGDNQRFDADVTVVAVHRTTTVPNWFQRAFLGGMMTLGPKAADRLTGPAPADVSRVVSGSAPLAPTADLATFSVDAAVRLAVPADKLAWADADIPASGMVPGIHLGTPPALPDGAVPVDPALFGDFAAVEHVRITPDTVEGVHIALAKSVHAADVASADPSAPVRKSPRGAGMWPSWGQRAIEQTAANSDGTSSTTVYRYKMSDLSKADTTAGKTVRAFVGEAGSRGVAALGLNGQPGMTAPMQSSGRITSLTGVLGATVTLSSPRLVDVRAEGTLQRNQVSNRAVAAGLGKGKGVDFEGNLDVIPRRVSPWGTRLRLTAGAGKRRTKTTTAQWGAGSKQEYEYEGPTAWVAVDARYTYEADMAIRNAVRTKGFDALPVVVDVPDGLLVEMPVANAVDLFTSLGKPVPGELTEALASQAAAADPPVVPALTLLTGGYNSYSSTTVIHSELDGTAPLTDVATRLEGLGVKGDWQREVLTQVKQLLSTPYGHVQLRDALAGDEALLSVPDSGLRYEDVVEVRVTAVPRAGGTPPALPASALPPDTQATTAFANVSHHREKGTTSQFRAGFQTDVMSSDSTGTPPPAAQDATGSPSGAEQSAGQPPGDASADKRGGGALTGFLGWLPGLAKVVGRIVTDPTSGGVKPSQKLKIDKLGREPRAVEYHLEIARYRRSTPGADAATASVIRLWDADRTGAPVRLAGTVHLVAPDASVSPPLSAPAHPPVTDVVATRPPRSAVLAPDAAWHVESMGATTAKAVRAAALTALSDAPVVTGRVDTAAVDNAARRPSEHTRRGGVGATALHTITAGSSLHDGAYTLFTGDDYQIDGIVSRKHATYDSLFDIAVSADFRPGSFTLLAPSPENLADPDSDPEIELEREIEDFRLHGETRTDTTVLSGQVPGVLGGTAGGSSLPAPAMVGGAPSGAAEAGTTQTTATAGLHATSEALGQKGRSYLFTVDADIYVRTRKHHSNWIAHTASRVKDKLPGRNRGAKSVTRVRSTGDITVRVWEADALREGLLTVGEIWWHRARTPGGGLSTASTPDGAVIYDPATGVPATPPTVPVDADARGRTLHIGPGVPLAEVVDFVAGLPGGMRPSDYVVDPGLPFTPADVAAAVGAVGVPGRAPLTWTQANLRAYADVAESALDALSPDARNTAMSAADAAARTAFDPAALAASPARDDIRAALADDAHRNGARGAEDLAARIAADLGLAPPPAPAFTSPMVEPPAIVVHPPGSDADQSSVYSDDETSVHRQDPESDLSDDEYTVYREEPDSSPDLSDDDADSSSDWSDSSEGDSDHFGLEALLDRGDGQTAETLVVHDDSDSDSDDSDSDSDGVAPTRPVRAEPAPADPGFDFGFDTPSPAPVGPVEPIATVPGIGEAVTTDPGDDDSDSVYSDDSDSVWSRHADLPEGNQLSLEDVLTDGLVVEPAWSDTGSLHSEHAPAEPAPAERTASDHAPADHAGSDAAPAPVEGDADRQKVLTALREFASGTDEVGVSVIVAPTADGPRALVRLHRAGQLDLVLEHTDGHGVTAVDGLTLGRLLRAHQTFGPFPLDPAAVGRGHRVVVEQVAGRDSAGFAADFMAAVQPGDSWMVHHDRHLPSEHVFPAPRGGASPEVAEFTARLFETLTLDHRAGGAPATVRVNDQAVAEAVRTGLRHQHTRAVFHGAGAATLPDPDRVVVEGPSGRDTRSRMLRRLGFPVVEPAVRVGVHRPWNPARLRHTAHEAALLLAAEPAPVVDAAERQATSIIESVFDLHRLRSSGLGPDIHSVIAEHVVSRQGYEAARAEAARIAADIAAAAPRVARRDDLGPLPRRDDLSENAGESTEDTVVYREDADTESLRSEIGYPSSEEGSDNGGETVQYAEDGGSSVYSDEDGVSEDSGSHYAPSDVAGVNGLSLEDVAAEGLVVEPAWSDAASEVSDAADEGGNPGFDFGFDFGFDTPSVPVVADARATVAGIGEAVTVADGQQDVLDALLAFTTPEAGPVELSVLVVLEPVPAAGSSVPGPRALLRLHRANQFDLVFELAEGAPGRAALTALDGLALHGLTDAYEVSGPFTVDADMLRRAHQVGVQNIDSDYRPARDGVRFAADFLAAAGAFSQGQTPARSVHSDLDAPITGEFPVSDGRLSPRTSSRLRDFAGNLFSTLAHAHRSGETPGPVRVTGQSEADTTAVAEALRVELRNQHTRALLQGADPSSLPDPDAVLIDTSSARSGTGSRVLRRLGLTGSPEPVLVETRRSWTPERIARAAEESGLLLSTEPSHVVEETEQAAMSIILNTFTSRGIRGSGLGPDIHSVVTGILHRHGPGRAHTAAEEIATALDIALLPAGGGHGTFRPGRVMRSDDLGPSAEDVTFYQEDTDTDSVYSQSEYAFAEDDDGAADAVRYVDDASSVYSEGGVSDDSGSHYAPSDVPGINELSLEGLAADDLVVGPAWSDTDSTRSSEPEPDDVFSESGVDALLADFAPESTLAETGGEPGLAVPESPTDPEHLGFDFGFDTLVDAPSTPVAPSVAPAEETLAVPEGVDADQRAVLDELLAFAAPGFTEFTKVEVVVLVVPTPATDAVRGAVKATGTSAFVGLKRLGMPDLVFGLAAGPGGTGRLAKVDGVLLSDPPAVFRKYATYEVRPDKVKAGFQVGVDTLGSPYRSSRDGFRFVADFVTGIGAMPDPGADAWMAEVTEPHMPKVGMLRENTFPVFDGQPSLYVSATLRRFAGELFEALTREHRADGVRSTVVVTGYSNAKGDKAVEDSARRADVVADAVRVELRNQHDRALLLGADPATLADPDGVVIRTVPGGRSDTPATIGLSAPDRRESVLVEVARPWTADRVRQAARDARLLMRRAAEARLTDVHRAAHEIVLNAFSARGLATAGLGPDVHAVVAESVYRHGPERARSVAREIADALGMNLRTPAELVGISSAAPPTRAPRVFRGPMPRLDFGPRPVADTRNTSVDVEHRSAATVGDTPVRSTADASRAGAALDAAMNNRRADIQRMRDDLAADGETAVRGTRARLIAVRDHLLVMGEGVTAALAADLATALGRPVVALVIGPDAHEPRRIRFQPDGKLLSEVNAEIRRG
ncbi:hypothetical protein ACTG9Q_27610 [Actinokineospora sp. 24-640]